MTKKKKSRHAKATDEGLEGFVDWTNSTVSQLAKEREVEMFGLVVGFAIWMCKRVANSQEGTIPGFEVPSDKCFRPSRSNEVQADPAVIVVDSPERVLEALSTVGGAAQDAS